MWRKPTVKDYRKYCYDDVSETLTLSHFYKISARNKLFQET